MKLTIITICLNAAKRIGRCIESVLAQTRLPQEYLFVDGGSTDGTLEQLAVYMPRLEYAGVHCRVVVQDRKEGEAGIPSAWNQGIAVAGGDVIALLNSDDWYEPETIATIMSRFEAMPSLEVLAGPVQMVSPDGKKENVLHPKSIYFASMLMPFAHPATFISRKLYARVGQYDTAFRISADYEFAWRCRKMMAEIAYFDQILVNMESGGAANSSRSLARNETLKIARVYAPYSPLPWLAWILRWLTGR